MHTVSPKRYREIRTLTAAGCSPSSQSTGQGTKHQLVVKASRSQQPISPWAQLCCQHGSLSLIFVFWRGQQPRLCSPKKFPQQPYNSRSLGVQEYRFSSTHTLQRAPPHAQRHRCREEGADDHARTHPAIAAGIPCLLLHPTLIATTTGAAHNTRDIHTPCRSFRPKYTPPLRTCCEASSRPTMCSAPPPSSS